MLRRTCAGRILLVLTVGIVLLGAVSAWANMITVDDSGGADYTTIQAAIDAASPGDTIHVAAGTYNEDVRIDKSLTLVSVDGKDTTIINGQNTGGGGALTVAGGLSGVVIGGTGTGFTINAAGGTARAVVLTANLSNLTLQDNRLVANGSCALEAWGGQSNHTIADNTFEGSASQLVYINGTTSVSLASTNVNFTSNTFAGTATGPALGMEAVNSDITGNTFRTTTGYTVLELFGAGNTITGNNFSSDLAAGAPHVTDFTNHTLAGYGGVLQYDIQALLDNNTFNRAVVVDHPGASLLPKIWANIQDGIANAVDGDDVHVAAGTYSETITFDAAFSKDNLTIVGPAAGSRPVVTGGVNFQNTGDISGLTLKNLYLKGDGSAGSNRIVNMGNPGAVNDFAMDNCVLDGENVPGRFGIYGVKAPLGGSFTITNTEFKDILGWGVLYTEDSVKATTVTFANNYIHDSNGAVALSGLSTDYADSVDVHGNVWENINTNPAGGPNAWAALEVNRSRNVAIYCNDASNVAGADSFQLWAIETLDFNHNNVLNNFQGLWIPGGGAASGDVSDWLLNYNSIVGNSGYGLKVDDTGNTGVMSATLNWWGSATGPNIASNTGSDGSGDTIIDPGSHVAYSPWLGIDPDGNSTLPGVQITGPMTIIVAPVGPKPTTKNGNTGYLNEGIEGSNELPYTDTIYVKHGTYDASEPITDAATIVSEPGSAAHTTLNGPISINIPDVLLGRLRQGFTINGPITVGAGVDASTIHINWNDIYDVVTNNGDNTLDATFNFWGDDGPDTVGLVAIYPYLPDPSDTIIGYMDEHGLNAIEAIDYANLLDLYLSAREALIGIELMETFGFSEEEAADIIDEYGAFLVDRALTLAYGDYDEFMLQLLGYVPGGGGGGGLSEEEITEFVIGDLIPLTLELLNPITGEVVDDAVVSYTVTRTLPDGTAEIVLFGVMPFDGDAGAYAFDLDTSSLEPGVYDVWFGTDDGRSYHYQIEITE